METIVMASTTTISSFMPSTKGLTYINVFFLSQLSEVDITPLSWMEKPKHQEVK